MPLHTLALTLCPGIGHVIARRLVTEVGSAEEVFRRRKELPDLIPDLQPAVVRALDCPDALRRATEEMRFVEAHGITCLTFTDPAYPSRLRECIDAPVILFFQGNTDLNAPHIVSVVGTRRSTDYGHQFCEAFARDLARLVPGTVVVSGLAYGTDIHAHRAAMATGLPTVAVLAHGLDRIYPPEHRQWAMDMRACGGLLTEYPSRTRPDRFNFVGRNRIIAGMADATVVVESAERGGALITASLANGYNRDCFALPGRVNDPQSQGCNHLIRDDGATLIQSAQDLVERMNWATPQPKAHTEPIQGNLFPDLTPEQECIVSILSRQGGSLDINTLSVRANISIVRLSPLLMDMELEGIISNRAGGNVVLRLPMPSAH